jgi:DNA-binding MarR family transcriptional regulator
VSNDAPDDRTAEPGPAPELIDRLGYLLKHAQQELAEHTAGALRPYGISGRELAVLLVLGGSEPASQQQAAGRLGIDRTTMVGFVDTLENRGLVERHPDANDRRRNVVVLTRAGRETLRDATRASDEAEHRFLAPLTESAAKQLKGSLRKVIETDP